MDDVSDHEAALFGVRSVGRLQSQPATARAHHALFEAYFASEDWDNASREVAELARLLPSAGRKAGPMGSATQVMTSSHQHGLAQCRNSLDLDPRSFAAKRRTKASSGDRGTGKVWYAA